MIEYDKRIVLKMIGKTNETKKAFKKNTGLHRQQVINFMAGGRPRMDTLCKIANGMAITDMNVFFRH